MSQSLKKMIPWIWGRNRAVRDVDAGVVGPGENRDRRLRRHVLAEVPLKMLHDLIP
jgi:hypothetical protein